MILIVFEFSSFSNFRMFLDFRYMHASNKKDSIMVANAARNHKLMSEIFIGLVVAK